MAVAAIVLALSVAAPELGAPAGAAPALSAGRTEMQARSAAHAARPAKRKRQSAAARRRARIARYLKGHPQVIARKLKFYPKLIVRQIRKLKARQSAVGKKKGKGAYFGGKKPVKKHKKKATKRTKRAKAAVAAKKNKKGTGGHPLGLVDYAEILLLALSPFAAVALFLFGADFLRRPRAPSRSKRRRSLVITPLKHR